MLERVVDLLKSYLSVPWGYVIVGAGTFLENSIGAGVVVPGETMVVLGGFYARVGDLSLPWVALVACAGGVLGDSVGYLIGFRYGRGFLDRHGRRFLITPPRLARADRYFQAHGGKTVFLGRFIPVVRSVRTVLAGVTKMEWRRFVAYDVASAAIWGVGYTVLGYLLGESYERWKGYLTGIGLVILAVLLLLIGATKLVATRRSVEGDLRELEVEQPQVGCEVEPTAGLEQGERPSEE